MGFFWYATICDNFQNISKKLVIYLRTLSEVLSVNLQNKKIINKEKWRDNLCSVCIPGICLEVLRKYTKVSCYCTRYWVRVIHVSVWMRSANPWISVRILFIRSDSYIFSEFYVYWTVHHLDSWIKTDRLDVTCFIISLFTVQHVSNVSTVIFRSLRLIVDLFHVLYCSGSMWYPYAGWSFTSACIRIPHHPSRTTP